MKKAIIMGLIVGISIGMGLTIAIGSSRESSREKIANFTEDPRVKTKILVLYYTKTNNTLKLAKEIVKGAQSYPNTEVTLRRIKSIGEVGAPLISTEELSKYDGIAIGSPVYFSSIPADLKYFLDQTLELWKEKSLQGRPVTVFMSAGSGEGKELAIQGLWSTLASHNMIIVPYHARNKKNEFTHAKKQGLELAKISALLKKTKYGLEKAQRKTFIEPIKLPITPSPVGNYRPYLVTGNHVYINQISIKKGKVLFPGKIGSDLDIEQAKRATMQTALNIISVLKIAVGGDLNKVKKVVQLTGHFNTSSNFTKHSLIMNEASDIMVKFFGKKGEHARAALGASSLPLNSSNEIQAIFEISN